MSVPEKELRDHIGRCDDAELLAMVEAHPDQYSPESLEFARLEIVNRGGMDALRKRVAADGAAREKSEREVRSKGSESDSSRPAKIRAANVFHIVVFGAFLIYTSVAWLRHSSVPYQHVITNPTLITSLGASDTLFLALWLLLPVEVSLLMVLMAFKRHLAGVSAHGYMVIGGSCLLHALAMIFQTRHYGLDPVVIGVALAYPLAVIAPLFWLGFDSRGPLAPTRPEKLHWAMTVLYFPVTVARKASEYAERNQSRPAIYWLALIVGLNLAAKAALVIQAVLISLVILALILIAIVIASWIISKFFGDESKRERHVSYSGGYERTSEPAPVPYRDSTLYNKDWSVVGHVSDDGKTLFDKDWTVIGHFSDDGKTIFDKSWNVTGHRSDDGRTIFDKDWNTSGHVSDDGKTIFDKNWNVSGHASE